VTGSVLSVAPEPAKTPEADLKLDAAFLNDLPITAPLAERPEVIEGETYKLKWPGSPHAIYVTINDDEHGNPFEIFMNSKNTEHFAWMVALTRMISAVFRRGGDVAFVADELEQVFDPRGGAWIEGKFITSPIAAIGGMIRRHMGKPPAQPQEAGFMMLLPKGVTTPDAVRQEAQADLPIWDEAGSAPIERHECGNCGSFNTKKESGCFVCKDCGHSACG
jgi:ribonucleoside-diphosphate reductase alpha chain